MILCVKGDLEGVLDNMPDVIRTFVPWWPPGSTTEVEQLQLTFGMMKPTHIHGLDAFHLGLLHSLLNGEMPKIEGPARVASGGAEFRSGMIGSA